MLDPCYITYQIGDPTKFVMQNGGYVSTLPDCDDGWDDEKEITRENKKRFESQKIFWAFFIELIYPYFLV